MDRATRKMVYFAFLGLLLAGSVIAFFQADPMLPKDGTVSVYISNIQSDIVGKPTIAGNSPQSGNAHVSGKPSGTLLSLNVTFDSVTIERNDNGSGVTTNTKFTFDLLRPFDVSMLISSGRFSAKSARVLLRILVEILYRIIYARCAKSALNRLT